MPNFPVEPVETFQHATMINPRAVIEDPNLSPSARLLYQMLFNRADERGEVQIHSRELAVRLGVRPDSITYLLNQLRVAGVISTRQQGRGKPMHYTLLSIALAIATAASISVKSDAGPTQLTLDSGQQTKDYRYSEDAEESELSRRRHGNPSEHDSDETGLVPTQGEPDCPEHINARLDVASRVSKPSGDSQDYQTQQQPAAYARAHEADELLLLGGLKKYGVDDADAAALLARYGPTRVRWQLRAMPFAISRRIALCDPIRRPGAYLRRAIERDFELPDELRAELRALSAQPRPENHAEAETRRIQTQLTERAVDELLETLPVTVRAQLEQRAKAEVDSHYLFGRLPATAKDGMIRATIVRLAREQLATSR